MLFSYRYGCHRSLHVRSHSFPTRRSSDLAKADQAAASDQSPEPVVATEGAATEGAATEGAATKAEATEAEQGTGAASASASAPRAEEHTPELQSLMRISYAVLCLKKTQHKSSHQT